MWRKTQIAISGLAALLLIGMGACVDLEVQNPNAPDAARVFETDEDIESLIAGAWKQIYLIAVSYSGPSMALSNVAFQHTAPWGNAGMEYYGRIPRQPVINAAGAADGPNVWNPWTWAYRGISAVRTGLRSIDEGVTDLGANETRARAYGKFMQGMAHGMLAMLYDSAFIYDETMEFDELVLHAYPEVLTAALGYLDDAISLSSGASFTVPASWLSQDVPAAELVQLAHSYKAQFRANVARTPAERAAVNWGAVVSDANSGVTEDWTLISDDWVTFGDDAFALINNGGWGMAANWVLGMADSSGNYQTWVNTRTNDKLPFYWFTPDTRFPQGGNATMTSAAIETVQLANPGANADPHGGYFYVSSGGYRVHYRPDRGTWRWSYYDILTNLEYSEQWVGPVVFVSTADLYFLKAEAEYRAGNLTTAATMVNSTRTLHGLNATDATGTNTSCVPKLPNGNCGDLWEMLKWEKRLQAYAIGLFHQGWYYDSRGWGDLIEGTFLHLPVIYTEYQLLGLKPYGTGGVGGNSAAPLGTYGFKHIP